MNTKAKFVLVWALRVVILAMALFSPAIAEWAGASQARGRIVTIIGFALIAGHRQTVCMLALTAPNKPADGRPDGKDLFRAVLGSLRCGRPEGAEGATPQS